MSKLPLDRRVTVPMIGCAGADVFYTRGGSGSGDSAAAFPDADICLTMKPKS